MTEDSSSEDSPTFIRRRRNVMVASMVVITILILDLQYNKINLFDVTAGAPWNFDIAWACLIWYFVWRLSQCPQPQELIGTPRVFYSNYWHFELQHSPLVKEYERRAIEGHNSQLKEKGASFVANRFNIQNPAGYTVDQLQIEATKFSDVTIHTTRPNWDIEYGLNYEITLKNKMAYSTEYRLVLPHTDRVARIATLRAYMLAAWTTQYFSEYLLPYWLGLLAIFYCCWHHFRS